MAWKNFKIDGKSIDCNTQSNFGGSYSTVVFVDDAYCGEILRVSTDDNNFTSKLREHLVKNGVLVS